MYYIYRYLLTIISLIAIPVSCFGMSITIKDSLYDSIHTRNQVKFDLENISFNKFSSDLSHHNKQAVGFSLKTNLLFDIVGGLNLGIEVPIKKNWSIEGQYIFPWWVNKYNNSFAFQVLGGTIEGRYWLNKNPKKRIMLGHFAGLYTGIGLYDIQLNRNFGDQGEFLTVGMTYGYSVPIINNKYSLEFSLRFGYLKTDYRHYTVTNSQMILAYDHSGKNQWIGPTGIQITISRLFELKPKRK